MGGAADSGTRVSLLGRLQRDPNDQQAWAEFVDLYGGRIYDWCKRWSLQDADAQDVTQNVLLKLAAKLREFRYDASRSFRGWLKTLAHHAWSDYAEARARPGHGTGDSAVGRLLGAVEAKDDLARHLNEAFDLELLQQAMARARLRVEPQTWEAFRLTALEGMAGADAALRIPMQVAQVYVAKRRVQRIIREEAALLEGELPGGER